jgi:endonuclease/exonuclease/phosphatase family metal-dependent hydrolase
VVAGDLNARPGDPELEALEGLGLVGALPDGRRTYPDAAPRVQIDHILIPPDALTLRADTLATGLSDHRFVLTDLRLIPDDDPDDD